MGDIYFVDDSEYKNLRIFFREEFPVRLETSGACKVIKIPSCSMQWFVSNLIGRVSCVLQIHMLLKVHYGEEFGEKQWKPK